MSRRRLERGYFNGRQVPPTEKEQNRIHVCRPRGGGGTKWMYRFGMTIHMDYPWPDTFTLEHRLPRKTKKALWKDFNGRPDFKGEFASPLPGQAPSAVHKGAKRR